MNAINQIYQTLEHVVTQIVKGFEMRDKQIHDLAFAIKQRDEVINSLLKRVSDLENQKIDDILLKESL